MAYATAAASVPVAVGDIQVYDGPDIGVGSGLVTLELDEFSVTIQVSQFSYRDFNDFGWSTCCGEYGGSPGGSCTNPGSIFYSYYRGVYSMVLGCFDSVDTIGFMDLGDAVQGTGDCTQWTPEIACSFSYVTQIQCGEPSSSGFSTCNDTRRFQAGFTTNRDGQKIFGWLEIESRGWSGLAITRWAYEDSGDVILVGETPPIPCPTDLDGSGRTDAADLGSLIAAWGPCAPKGACLADLDGDGSISASDLGLLAAGWGACPGVPCPTDCDDDIECTVDACIDGECFNTPIVVGACDLGSCCEDNGTPGCSDLACQDALCQFIPPCCDIVWDANCAALVPAFCPPGSCP